MQAGAAASNCSPNSTSSEVLSLNLIQTGCFLLAFLTCLIAVVLMGWKQSKSAEHSERLFLHIGLVMSFYALVNSFQWLALLDNAIGHYGCMAVALLNLYAALSVLVMTGCIGVHLVILVWQPRFIMVIKEAKVKIFKRLEQAYVLVTIALPIILVPWPFINGRYGNTGGSCWIKSEISDSELHSTGIIEQIVFWYLWLFILLIFTMVVVVVTLVILCCATPVRGNANLYALFSYLVIFLITSCLGAAIRVVGWAGIQTPYSVLLILVIAIPCGVGLRGLVFIMWVICIRRKKLFNQIDKDDRTTHVVSEKSGLVPSETFFVPSHEDNDI